MSILQLSFDFDVRTDEDGGLHVVAGTMPLVCHDTLYVSGSGCADNDGAGRQRPASRPACTTEQQQRAAASAAR